jgi:multidrug efflux pump subunit AcrB
MAEDLTLRDFQQALLVRRVVARHVEGKEFTSPEALAEYMKKHPGADKSKHTVAKPGGGGGGSEKTDTLLKKLEEGGFSKEDIAAYRDELADAKDDKARAKILKEMENDSSAQDKSRAYDDRMKGRKEGIKKRTEATHELLKGLGDIKNPEVKRELEDTVKKVKKSLDRAEATEDLDWADNHVRDIKSEVDSTVKYIERNLAEMSEDEAKDAKKAISALKKWSGA